jgi:uncharacterized protein YggE
VRHRGSDLSANDAAPRDGLTVTGSGSVTAPADRATVTIGVSTFDASVAAATDAADTASNRLIEAVRQRGGDLVDVTTSRYDVRAEVEHPSRRILGYRVEHLLDVTVRDLDRLGEIIAEAVRAGGDASVVQGLRFALEPTTERMDQARRLAWDDAAHRAGVIAEAAGRTLGPARAILEHQPPQGPAPLMRSRAAMAEAAAPVEAGDDTISVSLMVTFDWAD